MPSPGSSPVCTIGSSVFQQHAFRSCQTILWCPSRFSTGACSSHTIHYPTGLRLWPSQFESPRPINSAFPGNIHTLLKTTSDCYSHMKNWMTQNKLQLNGEKTEAMLVGTRQKLSFISVNTLQLDDTTVPLSDPVKSLGVLLDSTLFMVNVIRQTSKSCYYQLRGVSSARKYLSTEATENGHPTHSVKPRLLQFSPFWSACFCS